MLLFEIPAGTRVRVISNTIRLQATMDYEKTVAENVTWEGTVTDTYAVFKGLERRLLINPSIDFWFDSGVWLQNVECEVLA